MLREELVFGPIISRRLGSSLGINLLPTKGKVCNFDCIYCECGWNKDGLEDTRLPKAAELRETLNDKLSECLSNSITIDSITFSGDGEPTLNPDFAEIIDITLGLRDKYYPKAKVSVLTNGTAVGKEEVFAALKKVDNPILKLDAPTNELIAKINKPQFRYDVDTIVDTYKKFEGDFVLQTMFLKSDDFDSASPEVSQGWMRIVRELKPREIMVYTIDRETPSKNIEKFSSEKMKSIVMPLIEEGYNIQIKG